MLRFLITCALLAGAIALLNRLVNMKDIGRAVLVDSFEELNRFCPWHRVRPYLLGAINLLTFRIRLREQNLVNTSTILPYQNLPVPPFEPSVLCRRTTDGTYNDLDKPEMGMCGTRFGRNVPLSEAWPDTGAALMEPSPFKVSRKLMSRDIVNGEPKVKEAKILNLLAAAWIQFQTHDWFNHGEPVPGNEIEIPVGDGDDPWHESPMKIRRTRPDSSRAPDDTRNPPTYVNPGTHWWDASAIYGLNEADLANLRAGSDGKLKLGADGLLLWQHDRPFELTGFTDNWWIGLTILHTLFTREHNAICDHLKLHFPEWCDDELFHQARLVNAALLAKIHTIEWTLAILPQGSLKIGMNTNWKGLFPDWSAFAKELLAKIDEDLAYGIPGSETNHHGADYALTEEFVSVYRMHALIPERLELRELGTDKELHHFKMIDLVGPDVRRRTIDAGVGSMVDYIYSFLHTHPGGIALHNYPSFLQDIRVTMSDGSFGPQIDLAAVDIMRDRERGVPRYNRFRQLMHLSRVNTFEELTGVSCAETDEDEKERQRWANEIRELYEGDIDRVDLMVGLYAELPPENFGFSDTAFRVFILMATRRLKSDRFLSRDFKPDVYTKPGIDWVQQNTMSSVLCRHYPELRSVLKDTDNAFVGWQLLHPEGWP